MSLEPENQEVPERVPVPGGFIQRGPGETEEEFGRRADVLRLEARGTEVEDAEDRHAVGWRSHMGRCFAVPLGRRPPPGWRTNGRAGS